ncbi:MAG: glycoside hydrolase family 172 protein [Candidatus Latescibacterota bacterium]
MSFSGLHMGLGNIARLSDAKTRSVTAENVYGEKGRGGMAEVSATPQAEVGKIGQRWDGPNPCARDLGRTWKVRPCITIPAGRTATIMDVEGPGCIQHIWITVAAKCYRDLILRICWDGEEESSVETPLGDFFCNGFNTRADVLALPINVNPSGGFNCYFPMPFRERARITVQNRAPEDVTGFFYAVNYALSEVENDEAYFHAQFGRTNPLPCKSDYVLVDGIEGKGHFVGTYMAWQQNNTGWWGEGEIKFFMDGDTAFPTICGTGTEDYFGGAWCFGQTYSAPFLGYPLGSCEGKPGTRHGLYRFHIMDPIRFQSDLKVTMQAIGWRSEGRYLPLQDDISSVAYWYQAEPHHSFPEFPERDFLEVI